MIYSTEQIEVTHRIAWRRSWNGQTQCDTTTIANRVLLGFDSLTCQTGCSGTFGPLTFYCTDYSTSEDWTAGEGTFTYNAGSVTNLEAS